MMANSSNSLINVLFESPLSDLISDRSSLSISESEIFSLVIKSIKNKRSDGLLGRVSRAGLIGSVKDYYDECINLSIGEIKKRISEAANKPPIFTLIEIHCIWVAGGNKDNIDWGDDRLNKNKSSLISEFLIRDIDFLLSQNANRKTEPPPRLISEYIQGRRVLPPDTPSPGPIDIHKTPYTIEIMDCMSPLSPITGVAVMKGAQIGITTAAENVIGYWMDANPAAIMLMSATNDLLVEWVDKRLEPLIDSMGMRHKITAQTENNKKSRKSGDKATSKTFSGGFLMMVSAQSPGKMRSTHVRLLVRDEIDGAKKNLDSGEGSWVKVSEARTNSFGARKKIFDLSTPTTVEESAINEQYERGDQRQFFVPCPHCGEMQVLKFGGKKKLYGLIPEFDESENLVNVYYQCKACAGKIQNYHKTQMMNAGEWRPTAKSHNPLFRSYHISSLYSPVGMLSWKELYQKYLDAQDDPDGMRSFTNLYLGWPFKERGSRPKVEQIEALRGNYKRREVQPGTLFLTMAVDVQRGSEKDPNNPPRLEVEIRGHGKRFRSWSLDYKRFEGPIDNHSSGAWAQLHDWANDGGLTLKDKQGRVFPVGLIGIDSGDGVNTDTVYNFCRMWGNRTYPIKGFSVLRKHKKIEGDKVDEKNFMPWKTKRVDADLFLFEISTNHYKTNIYNNLNNSYLHKLRTDEAREPAGYVDFPVDYGAEYFNMLTAEEKHSDGSFHNPGGKRNEALDLAVYNSAAADFYLNQLVMDLRVKHKQTGGAEEDMHKINVQMALDWLEIQVARQPVKFPNSVH